MSTPQMCWSGRHRQGRLQISADMVGDPGSRVAFVAAPKRVVMRARRQPTRSASTCPLRPRRRNDADTGAAGFRTRGRCVTQAPVALVSAVSAGRTFTDNQLAGVRRAPGEIWGQEATAPSTASCTKFRL